MAILTCRGMSFAYDGKTVLEGVNFSLSAGDYLCIVGENGSRLDCLCIGTCSKRETMMSQLQFTEETHQPKVRSVQSRPVCLLPPKKASIFLSAAAGLQIYYIKTCCQNSDIFEVRAFFKNFTGNADFVQ